MRNLLTALSMSALLAAWLVVPAQAADKSSGYAQAMQAKIDAVEAERTTIAKNLKTFDELDFVVFSNQEWARLHESHSKDVKVHWPDGHTTAGIDKHIEDLKAMFVYARAPTSRSTRSSSGPVNGPR